MSEVVITKDNFQTEVIDSEKPVLLDFWATWCGPCQMIAPLVEQIAKENPEIKVGKIDVDRQPELAVNFKVASIPTLVVVKNGKVTKTGVGYMPKEKILELLDL